MVYIFQKQNFCKQVYIIIYIYIYIYSEKRPNNHGEKLWSKLFLNLHKFASCFQKPKDLLVLLFKLTKNFEGGQDIADSTAITNITDLLQKSQILQLSQNYPKGRPGIPIAENADIANIVDILQNSQILQKDRYRIPITGITDISIIACILQKWQILQISQNYPNYRRFKTAIADIV